MRITYNTFGVAILATAMLAATFANGAFGDVTLISPAPQGAIILDDDDGSLPVDIDTYFFNSGQSIAGPRRVEVTENSIVNFAGGNVDEILFLESSILEFESGSSASLTLDGTSSAVISGGSITNFLINGTGNNVTINGGSIDAPIGLVLNGTLDITGGSIGSGGAGSATVNNGGALNISGGSFNLESLTVNSGGSASITGGLTSNSFALTGAVEMSGTEFFIESDDGSGPVLTSVNGTLTDSDFSAGDRLVGKLDDGTNFSVDIALSGGTINLIVSVPEPTSAVILSLGLAGCLIRRKRTV